VDELDKVQAAVEATLENDLRREHSRLAAEARMKGTTHCCDCGCEIPEARRIAVPSACFCVECQEERE
jgi:phage/conjugal plasmid C-4 type zinc finger TraR family protein